MTRRDEDVLAVAVVLVDGELLRGPGPGVEQQLEQPGVLLRPEYALAAVEVAVPERRPAADQPQHLERVRVEEWNCWCRCCCCCRARRGGCRGCRRRGGSGVGRVVTGGSGGRGGDGRGGGDNGGTVVAVVMVLLVVGMLVVVLLLVDEGALDVLGQHADLVRVEVGRAEGVVHRQHRVACENGFGIEFIGFVLEGGLTSDAAGEDNSGNQFTEKIAQVGVFA